jgi:hypothetical protein
VVSRTSGWWLGVSDHLSRRCCQRHHRPSSPPSADTEAPTAHMSLVPTHLPLRAATAATHRPNSHGHPMHLTPPPPLRAYPGCLLPPPPRGYAYAWGATHATTLRAQVYCRGMRVAAAARANHHPNLLPPISLPDPPASSACGVSKEMPGVPTTAPYLSTLGISMEEVPWFFSRPPKRKPLGSLVRLVRLEW